MLRSYDLYIVRWRGKKKKAKHTMFLCAALAGNVSELFCGRVTKSLRGKGFWGSDFANRQLISTQSSADLKLPVCSTTDCKAHAKTLKSICTLCFTLTLYAHTIYATDTKPNKGSAVGKHKNFISTADSGSLCINPKNILLHLTVRTMLHKLL